MHPETGPLRHEATLAARVLMSALFLVFGWGKLMSPAATAAFFAQDGVPLPALACAIAILAELGGGLALLAGALTRPLAILLAVYTMATAFLGHAFWTMTGAAHLANEINFLKNVSITGGLLALFVTGAGRYSLDGAMSRSPGARAGGSRAGTGFHDP